MPAGKLFKQRFRALRPIKHIPSRRHAQHSPYLFAVLFCIALIRAITTATRTSEEAPPLPARPDNDLAIVKYAIRAMLAVRHGLEIKDGWRDCGGHGTIYAEGVFVYGGSMDGIIAPPSQAHRLFHPDTDRREFNSEQDICDWLLNTLNDPQPTSRLNSPASSNASCMPRHTALTLPGWPENPACGGDRHPTMP